MSPEYSVELWDLDGVFQADVSSILSSNLVIKTAVNDAEDISFSIDSVQFENLCSSIGATPRNLLEPYQTDVRIRRNNEYLVGAQVVYVEESFDVEGRSISVKCTGYLNYFKDRYVTKDYSGMTYAEIAWNLIDTTQSVGPNWDFGVTLGGDTASALQDDTRVRNYVRQEVKDGILNLTKLESDNFEFYFTADKQVYFTSSMGSVKSHIELVYPQNIKNMSVERDASTLKNHVTLLGSGIGEETLSSVSSDPPSQLNYKARQLLSTNNDVILQDTLDEQSVGLLNIYKDIYVKPTLTIEPNVIDFNDVWLGDSIVINNTVGTFTPDLLGIYRIMEISLSISKDGEELASLVVEAV